ncbi:Rv1733c family protein [Streptomyces sp. NPDC002530]
MRALTGVWRWRHNPLRRATDRREAWVALVAFLVLVVGAPVVGWLCGARADAALLDAVRAQRAERRATTAVVVRRVAPRQLVAEPESGTDHRAQTPVVARWKAPDGTARVATVRTLSRDTEVGARVRIWTDRAGRLVSRPMDTATAHTNAVLAGVGGALLAAPCVEGGRRLIVRRMMRLRYARLDRAWAEAGPDWGRTGTGS